MSDAMSIREAMFICWAPDEDMWTPWAKPVLFKSRGFAGVVSSEPTEAASIFSPDELDMPVDLGRAVVIIDLPGVKSVTAGLALADQGYRPVPLYNGCEGPGAVVSVEGLAQAVFEATEKLRVKPPALNAPPAFLLDSNRMSGYSSPGRFDNRWMVFPQDFPSANFLLSKGYQQAVVVLNSSGPVAEDLAHVLLRWQEAGVQIKSFSLSSHAMEDVIIRKPSQYKLFLYRALARMGLRPNSAGGFGDLIPVPSETSYGGYG
jgi:hypothetical protein